MLNGNGNTYDSPMTLTDLDYGVSISYQVTETVSSEYNHTYASESMYIEEGGSEYAVEEPVTETTTNTYTAEYTVGFFHGCVPEEFLQITEE